MAKCVKIPQFWCRPGYIGRPYLDFCASHDTETLQLCLKICILSRYEEKLIRNLNFSVNKGEIVSFIGESGSGKTTFLKCLAGLEKINSGSIELNGKINVFNTQFNEFD